MPKGIARIPACAFCVRGLHPDSSDKPLWATTGRRREQRRGERARGSELAEVRCRRCGHVWWSNSPKILATLAAEAPACPPRR